MLFHKRQKNFYAKQLPEYMQYVTSGKSGYLPYIFCIFSERDAKAQRNAAKFLSEQLETFTFDDSIKIDLQMREKTSIEWSVAWRDIKPEDFLLPKMTASEKRAVLIFASFHPNGYFREKAVKRLADYSLSLPYILLRVNDWAEPPERFTSRFFKGYMERYCVRKTEPN